MIRPPFPPPTNPPPPGTTRPHYRTFNLIDKPTKQPSNPTPGSSYPFGINIPDNPTSGQYIPSWNKISPLSLQYRICPQLLVQVNQHQGALSVLY